MKNWQTDQKSRKRSEKGGGDEDREYDVRTVLKRSRKTGRRMANNSKR